ncbi:ABC transporter ATP-binding protein [Pseudochrobactrum kiredjianiae]|uniref:ABC transporter ATP-binding protein n=1 Tax=Pseudochrobactrum kiredjianiae TaxID=386305 RepID=A0ABW3V009_9HYPH|nr:ABC transporter ATP-binding protein [Pseudochrobactrum kiredjianiae]MDM7852514.1 ABC transporter ATP-binding protein [Pseudochrobactrum kiredjianiae]
MEAIRHSIKVKPVLDVRVDPNRETKVKKSRTNGSEAKELSLLIAMRLLFSQLSPARRRAFLPLLLLMLAGAVAEVVSIGAILPLLAFIASPASITIDNANTAGLLDFLGAGDSNIAVYVVIGLFTLATLVAAVLRLSLLWASNSFIYGMSYELGVKLYADTLLQSYSYHTQHNSSEIIASINKVQMATNNVLLPIMQSIIAAVIGLFIIVGLVIIDPMVAFVAGLGFGAIYLLASVTARKRLRANSVVIARAQSKRVQTMQEGVGGIRDILLDGSQPIFVEIYEQAEAGFRDARVKNAFLGGAPRFIVEAVGMVLIATIAVVVVQRPGGLATALPILGALALGAQRLLPLIQQVYGGWASAMGNSNVLKDIVQLLSRSSPAQSRAIAALPFEHTITLDNLTYTYPGARAAALNGISLRIPKGARVGIAGKTGSGKSTLMDIVLGLLQPEDGMICIDAIALTEKNRGAWQSNIAHVPQSIFLADASISENIAFGVRYEDIDIERVQCAAEQAELADVIAALPQGYETKVGERGIQLSGGQRQRIGIARALYKQASVLVFDEATSALDTATESAVMNAINRLDRNLTILIIAHRLSTLEGCDMVVQLEGGSVKVIPL